MELTRLTNGTIISENKSTNDILGGEHIKLHQPSFQSILQCIIPLVFWVCILTKVDLLQNAITPVCADIEP